MFFIIPLAAAAAPAITSAVGGGTAAAAGGSAGISKILGLVGGGKGGGGAGGGAGGAGGGALLAGKALISGIQGAVGRKKAEKAFPQQVDPEERALQVQTRRKLRAVETGTADQAEREALKGMTKQGMTNVFRMGGGMRGLNKMTELFQKGILGLKTASADRELKFSNLLADATKRISQRKLELGLLKYNTLSARAEQAKKESKGAMNLALARAVGTGDVANTGTTGAKAADMLGGKEGDIVPKTSISDVGLG